MYPCTSGCGSVFSAQPSAKSISTCSFFEGLVKGLVKGAGGLEGATEGYYIICPLSLSFSLYIFMCMYVYKCIYIYMLPPPTPTFLCIRYCPWNALSFLLIFSPIVALHQEKYLGRMRLGHILPTYVAAA